ncbi:transcription factor bHLH115-like isoform X2 [Hevea brasiliensis]|uniref:transcription factor bHLH115-like isoform X2 n=1 Tax=Hevea brasiliensis TaxID=3981 RepID=UPI0025E14953|nr:transcription factor bHLH115-like isoform X2 [Hevea brasiliensis]
MEEVQSSGCSWSSSQIIIDKKELSWGSQSCELDVEVDVLQNGMDSVKDLCSKKRARLESSSGLGTKACREKMRRDMLNERFTELYSILEPGISQNSNQVAILRHATHHLNHLRLEAKELKDKNKLLQETMNSLKEEKMELQEEKLILRAHKKRMEQICQWMSPASVDTS